MKKLKSKNIIKGIFGFIDSIEYSLRDFLKIAFNVFRVIGFLSLACLLFIFPFTLSVYLFGNGLIKYGFLSIFIGVFNISLAIFIKEKYN
jgi:hypothetical protein